MMVESTRWDKPRITANAQMLSGYLAGMLDADEGMYELVGLGNPTLIRNRETGNLYHVTVEQIAGEE